MGQYLSRPGDKARHVLRRREAELLKVLDTSGDTDRVSRSVDRVKNARIGLLKALHVETIPMDEAAARETAIAHFEAKCAEVESASVEDVVEQCKRKLA